VNVLVKRVSEIAKETGVSLQTVYRHLKKIDAAVKAHVYKEKGIVTLDEEGELLLKQSLSATTTAVVPSLAPAPATADLTLVVSRLEAVERAILLLVEENKRLANENGALRMFLAPPPPPPKPMVVWHPERIADPLDGMPWYRRLWVEWFEPWKMRRSAI